MTPKQRAEMLKNKFGKLAIDCVMEIISTNPHSNTLKPSSTMAYWIDVQKELLK